MVPIGSSGVYWASPLEQYKAQTLAESGVSAREY